MQRSNNQFERSRSPQIATWMWQRTKVREASRARAPDSPCRARAGARTARPDEGQSMIWINQLRWMSAQPHVDQPHR
jgi:hypothetical protein